MLKTKSFALALALTAGIAYIICAIVIAVSPETAVSLYGTLAHLQSVEPRTVTFAGTIGGLIQVLIYAYLFGWVLSSLYNKYTK